MPVKVYELAKELKKTNTEMVGLLDKRFGLRVGPTSDLDEATAGRIRTTLSESDGNGTAPASQSSGNGTASGTNGASRPAAGASARTATPAAPSATAPASAPSGEAVEVPANVTVRELGERLGLGAGAVQKVLMDMGVLAAMNQRLAPDAVQRIAAKIGSVSTYGGKRACRSRVACCSGTRGCTNGSTAK